MFDLPGLARYLGRDARELERLAERGKLPGRRVKGEWRFSRTEVHYWLEHEMAALTDRQLENLERGLYDGPSEPQLPDLLVTSLMSTATTAIPLDARTAPGVIQKLIEVANGSWQVYMPDRILAAVKEREEMLSTALPGGVAIPHTRRPMPECLADSLIAFGRTYSGIPFGGPKGELSDLFFLVLCRDDKTHLHVLARLARMFQREGFLDRLRDADNAVETLDVINETESEILA